MTIQEIFIGAEHALANVVNQIKDNQWSMEMPPEFATRAKPGSLTLREVINYHAYDDAWVPDTLAGKTIAEVDRKYDGDLLGDDPKAAWQNIVEAAIRAVSGLREDDLERTVHLTYGDWPAKEYLRHITSFRGFRAVDIARVIGVSDRLPGDLVQGMWDSFTPDIEDWRKMGVFGPAISVPDDADLQSKLLGIVGRQPSL